MPIPVQCPSCSVKLKVPDNLAGRTVKCPKCQTATRVPAEVVAVETVPAAPAPSSQLKPEKVAASAVTSERPGKDDFEDNLKDAPGVRRKARRDEEDDFDENLKDAPGTKRRGRKQDDEDEDDRPAKRSRRRDNDFEEEKLESCELPEALQNRVDEELTRKEKLVWIGQPDQDLTLKRAIFPAIGMFCMALFMTGVMTVIALTQAQYIILAFVIIPVIIMGVAIISPFYQKWRAKNTCYVLTNRRAIVWQTGMLGAMNMTNYSPMQLTGMRRIDAWLLKGAGDVVFKSVTVITTTHYTNRRGGYAGSSTSSRTYLYGFLAVRQVRAVEALVRETLVEPYLAKQMGDDDD